MKVFIIAVLAVVVIAMGGVLHAERTVHSNEVAKLKKSSGELLVTAELMFEDNRAMIEMLDYAVELDCFRDGI